MRAVTVKRLKRMIRRTGVAHKAGFVQRKNGKWEAVNEYKRVLKILKSRWKAGDIKGLPNDKA